MRRSALVVFVVLAFSAVFALSIAIAARHTSGSKRVQVSPAKGSRRTRFVIRFTAPQTSGSIGSTVRGYEVSVTGHRRSKCLSAASQPAPGSRKGARVKVTLDPAHFGAAWCAGAFAGRIEEFEAPSCGPGRVCPLFIRLGPIVARFSFRVSG
jgi:hypothetical protein